MPLLEIIYLERINKDSWGALKYVFKQLNFTTEHKIASEKPSRIGSFSCSTKSKANNDRYNKNMGEGKPINHPN